MKKYLTIAMTSVLALTGMIGLAGCGGDSSNEVKIGVILVGDENEGYSLAHINGIEEAKKALNLTDDQVIYEKKVAEDSTCYDTARDLVAEGCSLIISNSYSHQEFMEQAAKEYTDVTFVAATGDYAAISGLNNFKNAFTDVYESRYVSGVVAGMKLKQLVDDGTLKTDSNHYTNGNWKIGYVGAFTYAEVVSGYTAFFLGIKSIVPNVSMEVKFTNDWFSVSKEASAAEALVNDGCVIIGQHADSTGAPSKIEDLQKEGKICYSVGYNIDMLSVAPNAALTSSTNNWGSYYKYAFEKAVNGKTNEILTDWAEGYDTNTVAITALGKSCPTGTAEKVAEVETGIKNGTLKVFDTSKFTVSTPAKNGEYTVDENNHITSYKIDTSYYSFATNAPVLVHQGREVETVKKSGETTYITESEVRSAPYFALNVDGIVKLSD